MNLLITTSRKPARRVRSLCKELGKLLPKSVYITRGKMSLEEIFLKALDMGAKHVLVVNVKKGNPSRMDLYNSKLKKLKTSFVCSGVKLAREMGIKVSRIRNTAVIVKNGEELKVLGKSLSEALEIPLINSNEISSFNIYDGLIVLSSSEGTLGMLTPVDCPHRRPIGPFLKISKKLI